MTLFIGRTHFVLKVRPSLEPIVILAVLIHFVSGIVLIIDGQGMRSTPLFALKFLGNADIVGVVLLIVAGLALIEALFDFKCLTSLMLLLPQQIVLFASGLGAWEAIWHQRYADGTPMAWAHITTDQLATVLTAILHGWAVFRIVFAKLAKEAEIGFN